MVGRAGFEPAASNVSDWRAYRAALPAIGVRPGPLPAGSAGAPLTARWRLHPSWPLGIAAGGIIIGPLGENRTLVGSATSCWPTSGPQEALCLERAIDSTGFQVNTLDPRRAPASSCQFAPIVFHFAITVYGAIIAKRNLLENTDRRGAACSHAFPLWRATDL